MIIDTNCLENELFGVSLDNIQEYRMESNKESPPSNSERRQYKLFKLSEV